MVTGVVLIGLQAGTYLQEIMLQRGVNSMNHVLTNSIAPAESTIAIALILMVAVVKAIRHLSKRLSLSRLTLQTDSSILHLQIKPHSSLQESLQQEPQGEDEDGNSNDDDGRIPSTLERPQF